MSYGPRHYHSVNRWNIYLPGVDVETWENALVPKKAYNVDSNKDRVKEAVSGGHDGFWQICDSIRLFLHKLLFRNTVQRKGRRWEKKYLLNIFCEVQGKIEKLRRSFNNVTQSCQAHQSWIQLFSVQKPRDVLIKLSGIE